MIASVKGGVLLHLFIQPKASRNEVIGPHNGEIKIKLSAPPVDGAANEELIEYLSKIFKIPKRQISLLKGDTNRHKVVQLMGVEEETAKVILKAKT